MPILFRSKILLAKVETTYGTDAAPTGAANAVLAREIKISPMEGQDLSRELDLPNMGAQPTIPVDVHAKISFKVELAAPGAAGTLPAWAPLLRACGCAQTVVAATSVTFNPISSGHESATLWFVIGSTLYKMVGARGNAKFTANASGIPYIEFDFTGLFVSPAEGVRPTPDFTAWKKPGVVTNANTPVFTLGATPMVMRSFALDLGNQIEPRFLVGSEGILLSDHAESIDTTVEAVPLTTLNPYALAAAQTQLAVTLQHGTTAGNRITISAPTAQVQRPAGLEENQGIAEWPLKLVPLQNAGNDQWTLAIT